MDQFYELFKSIPDDKLVQYNKYATIVSGMGDLSSMAMFKGKIPLSPGTLKKISQWASLIALITQLLMSYRKITG